MGKRLYVGNLPWSTSSSDLQALFEPFGAVRSAEVIMDRVTGRSRGFGFVEMDNDDAMNSAVEALNGKDMNGRPMVVNEARERSPRPYGGGGGGGGAAGGGRAPRGAGRYGDR
ncbi:MAG: RNA recognition motif domain-containing protein [Pirellulaceae bacterium]